MQLSVDDKQSMNDQEIDVTNDSVAQQNIRLLQVERFLLSFWDQVSLQYIYNNEGAAMIYYI